MKILNEAGINLLQSIREQIKPLLPKPEKEMKSRSLTHTQERIVAVNELLTILIENNDTSYWDKEENVNRAMRLLNLLDGAKRSYSIDVFNEETRILANAFLKVASVFNFSNHLASPKLASMGASIFNSLTGGDIKALPAVIARILELKIKFHQQLRLKNPEEKYQALRGRFETHGNTFVADITKAAEKERFALFSTGKKAYDAMAAELLQLLPEFPYVTLSHDKKFLSPDSGEPYRFTCIERTESRRAKVRDLLNFEFKLNTVMKNHKLPFRLDCIQTHFAKSMSPKDLTALDARVQAQVDELKKITCVFMAGKKQTLFDKKESARNDFVLELHTSLTQTMNENQSSGTKCHAIHLKLSETLSKSDKVEEEKFSGKIDFVRIMKRHAEQFCLIGACEEDERNDLEILNLLMPPPVTLAKNPKLEVKAASVNKKG